MSLAALKRLIQTVILSTYNVILDFFKHPVYKSIMYLNKSFETLLERNLANFIQGFGRRGVSRMFCDRGGGEGGGLWLGGGEGVGYLLPKL